jgi:hypothetical protein
MYIDQTVYPDLSEPPTALISTQDKAEYVHRVCTAWDHHVHPEPATFHLFSTWKEVFDQYPVLTSPGYHAFRAWFGWEPIAVPVDLPPPTPLYVHLDRLEDRPADPCERMI